MSRAIRQKESSLTDSASSTDTGQVADATEAVDVALHRGAAGRRNGVQWRVVAAIAGHLLGAGAWWFGMPQGFPIGHPRWWANSVLPVVVVVGCGVVLWRCIVRRRVGIPEVGIVGAALAAMWLAAAVVTAGLFTQSGTRPALACAAIGGCGALLLWWGRVPRTSPLLLVVALGVGISIGAVGAASQHAPPAGTHPLLAALPASRSDAMRPDVAIATGDPQREHHHADELARLAHDAVRIGHFATLDRETGELTLDSGPLRISCDPVLRFQSRSPDGFWTLFANRNDRVGPQLKRTGLELIENGVRVEYESDYAVTLSAASNGPRVEVDATATLRKPIFSHLNTYCELVVMGHHRLSLAFSPCPGARVEVLPADYPVGRPVRAAWLAADGIFRVVEASNAEKGPFRILGEGTLRCEAPLSIDLFDEDRPIARVTLMDWAAQVDTSLSPTAGWGAPANAIQFQREGTEPTEPAYIFITLASTSLGRGWDSVGHAAGMYRNRMTLEPIDTGK